MKNKIIDKAELDKSNLEKKNLVNSKQIVKK
jgi:hypothetical protein